MVVVSKWVGCNAPLQLAPRSLCSTRPGGRTLYEVSGERSGGIVEELG
jgi:hypothetical protein